MEMDAASRTGIGDIREILEGVRYSPVSARYKVYIIDEIHMLSTAAFNALLKTLEEPPGHVKFVFATTEIRKVPVTVLSRCQRFDLKRVDRTVLADHLENIARTEGANVEREGLLAIARAAEGSVRDALSLLDQAIVQAEGDGPVSMLVGEYHKDGSVRAYSRFEHERWAYLDRVNKGEKPHMPQLFGPMGRLGLIIVHDRPSAGQDPDVELHRRLQRGRRRLGHAPSVLQREWIHHLGTRQALPPRPPEEQ